VAIFYVRSTDGSDSDNGSTWALAKATLTGALNGVAGWGDIVYVSQVHSESTTFINPTPASTAGSIPIQIICANDGAQPPTATATTAVVATTSSGNITLSAEGLAYYYGLTFQAGVGQSTTASITAAPVLNTRSEFESCNFVLSSTGASSVVAIYSFVTALNCTFKFAASGQNILLGNTVIRGGGAASGGTSPTTAFKALSAGTGAFLVEGFDFSNWSAGVNLYDSPNTSSPVSGIFRDCKLPASWSGSLVTTPANMAKGSVIELINCSAGAVNYAYWRQTILGSVRHETTVVLGTSDGTTVISWKMVSTASANFPVNPLISEDLFAWNETVGSSVTATVEIVTDSVTLKDDEIYLEVMYLSSTGTPIATRIADCKATFLTTAANQDSSTAAWTTTGLTTPVKQKASVTFTPQMKGYVIARVHLAKASTTVYVDPTLKLT
jgi:hypothetical protein